MEPIETLTSEQERMLLDLMVGTFEIPENRARLYLLKFREQMLEERGDALLAEAGAMEPRSAEKALQAFLAQIKELDQQFKDAEKTDG